MVMLIDKRSWLCYKDKVLTCAVHCFSTYSIDIRDTEGIVWWPAFSFSLFDVAVKGHYLWCHLCFIMPPTCETRTIRSSRADFFCPKVPPVTLNTGSLIMGHSYLTGQIFQTIFDWVCKRCVRDTVERCGDHCLHLSLTDTLNINTCSK